jgi:hypothetical protein
MLRDLMTIQGLTHQHACLFWLCWWCRGPGLIQVLFGVDTPHNVPDCVRAAVHLGDGTVPTHHTADMHHDALQWFSRC